MTKIFTSQKGIALIVAFSVIVVVSIYLSSYVIWAIWDQRNLIRQQGAEEADKIARAGLNRAILDLYQKSDSWLNGVIGTRDALCTCCSSAPCPADPGNPNTFYTLYSETLKNGTYVVEIRYLYESSTGTFLDKRMWVRSTGTFPTDGTSTSRVLEQIVNYYSIKNFNKVVDGVTGVLYANLQLAIKAADNDNKIGISAVILNENLTINATTAKTFNIYGGYDPNFSDVNRRSCSNYPTIINGNLTITGSADVYLSGMTIE